MMISGAYPVSGKRTTSHEADTKRGTGPKKRQQPILGREREMEAVAGMSEEGGSPTKAAQSILPMDIHPHPHTITEIVVGKRTNALFSRPRNGQDLFLA